MDKNKIAVYGICNSRTTAESAVEMLKNAGFTNSDISVLFSTPDNSKEFAHENSTKSPEGAATGAVSGAAVGGILGWLAGIGTLAIPGVGPLIAAGPIMATLAGVGIGGTVGGLTGALVGLGIPEYEAKRYEGQINDGGILISVHAEDDKAVKRAEDILTKVGAESISSKEEECSKTSKDADDRRSTL